MIPKPSRGASQRLEPRPEPSSSSGHDWRSYTTAWGTTGRPAGPLLTSGCDASSASFLYLTKWGVLSPGRLTASFGTHSMRVPRELGAGPQGACGRTLMNLVKLVAQFLLLLAVGYVVAVAMTCAIGGGCPFQGLSPSKPASTWSSRSAPSTGHYAQSPKRWSTAFRRYGRSSKRRTAWSALPSAAFSQRLATAEGRASLATRS
jgi:hypothetical protein